MVAMALSISAVIRSLLLLLLCSGGWKRDDDNHERRCLSFSIQHAGVE